MYIAPYPQELYPFLTTALEGGEGSASSPGRSLPPGKDPVSIVREAGWAPGPVWTGAKNLAPTGIRSPDRPVRSQSLYRLRYLAPVCCVRYWILWVSSRSPRFENRPNGDILLNVTYVVAYRPSIVQWLLNIPHNLILASFPCKLNTFRKMVKNVVTGKGIEVGIVGK